MKTKKSLYFESKPWYNDTLSVDKDLWRKENLYYPKTKKEYMESMMGSFFVYDDAPEKDQTVTLTVPKRRNNKEENNMTNTNNTARKLVSVVMMDQNPNVPAANCVVARYDNVVMVGDDKQAMLLNLVMTEDVSGMIKLYNEERQKIVDRKILERTGQAVNLEPITIQDLDIQVKM